MSVDEKCLSHRASQLFRWQPTKCAHRSVSRRCYKNKKIAYDCRFFLKHCAVVVNNSRHVAYIMSLLFDHDSKILFVINHNINLWTSFSYPGLVKCHLSNVVWLHKHKTMYTQIDISLLSNCFNCYHPATCKPRTIGTFCHFFFV